MNDEEYGGRMIFWNPAGSTWGTKQELGENVNLVEFAGVPWVRELFGWQPDGCDYLLFYIPISHPFAQALKHLIRLGGLHVGGEDDDDNDGYDYWSMHITEPELRAICEEVTGEELTSKQSAEVSEDGWRR